MTILGSVHRLVFGVARIRLYIDDFAGDALIVAVDAVPEGWAAVGDVLLREDCETADEAQCVASGALRRWPGASSAVAAHPGGYVIATRTTGITAVATEPRRSPERWSTRLSSVAEFDGSGITQFGVEGSSFGEMAGALLLAAVLQLDLSEGGEDFSCVVRGIECAYRP